jgi:hypothetical protein
MAERVRTVEDEELPDAQMRLDECEGQGGDCDELRREIQRLRDEVADLATKMRALNDAVAANPPPAKPDESAGYQLVTLEWLAHGSMVCSTASGLSTAALTILGTVTPFAKWKIITAKDLICQASAWAAFAIRKNSLSIGAVAQASLFFLVDQALSAAQAATHCRAVCAANPFWCAGCWATYTMHCGMTVAAVATAFAVEPVALQFHFSWLFPDP